MECKGGCLYSRETGGILAGNGENKSPPRDGQVKVLFLVTAYPRAEDDLITPWLVQTIHRLRERGIEVEVLAPSYRGSATGTLDGVRVHRFRYAPAAMESLTHDQTAPDRIRERPLFLGLVPGYVAAGSVAAARLARSGQFEVLHAFWPLPHGIMGLAAKRVSGVPLVCTFFGVELTWMRSEMPLLSTVLRTIVRGSDAVTAISSYTAATLRDAAPAAEPVVIPFGAAVSPSLHSAAAPDRPAHAPFELLFVGRLVERKGVAVLLEAVALLGAESDVRLQVVGEGPLRDRLERRAARLGIAGRVVFHGAVSEEELQQRFSRCDVFLLPAVVDRKGDTEGLGVVLLEAMQHGKPVIASRTGGIIDIVMDGDTGLLVPPGDPGAVAAAVRRLMQDPAFAAGLAARGREHMEQHFSWSSVVDRLAHLYRSVARPERPVTPG
jgi:glycosyltransferase involved in cell wall biosynthesis